MWHVPEDQGSGPRVIDAPLYTLNHGSYVNTICYNNIEGVLASGHPKFAIDRLRCGNEIKFWTPLSRPFLSEPVESAYIPEIDFDEGDDNDGNYIVNMNDNNLILLNDAAEDYPSDNQVESDICFKWQWPLASRL